MLVGLVQTGVYVRESWWFGSDWCYVRAAGVWFRLVFM